MLDGNAVQILRGLTLGEQVIISSYDAFRHLEEIEILPAGRAYAVIKLEKISREYFMGNQETQST